MPLKYLESLVYTPEQILWRLLLLIWYQGFQVCSDEIAFVVQHPECQTNEPQTATLQIEVKLLVCAHKGHTPCAFYRKIIRVVFWCATLSSFVEFCFIIVVRFLSRKIQNVETVPFSYLHGGQVMGYWDSS